MTAIPVSPPAIQEVAARLLADDLEAVARLVQPILRLRPDDADGWMLRGIALRRLGQPQAGATALGRAIRLAPGRGELHHNHALCLADLGRGAEAEAGYRRAMATSPELAEPYFCLAEVLQARGDAAAIGLYTEAVARAPRRSGYAVAAGCAALRLHQSASALTFFHRALTSTPDVAELWFNIGVAHGLTRSHAPAAIAYRRAARLQPGNAKFAYNRARAEMLEHRLDLALALADVGIARTRGEDFHWLCLRAEILEAMGRDEEAIAAYGVAMRSNEAYGLPYTRLTCLRLRRLCGTPPPSSRPLPADGRGVVTMESLGRNGRFGNQLLQYGFLRLYAAEYGLHYQVPDWPGRYLFDLDDPAVTEALPRVEEGVHPLEDSLARTSPEVFANRDIGGYFCGSTRCMAGHVVLFRSLFQPSACLRPVIDAAEAALRARGRQVVALHLRRGDYGYDRFWIAPEAWYRDWLARLWPLFDDPVLFIASDDTAIAQAFADYRPVTLADLGVPVPHGLAFFLDWGLLGRADALAISNSTFSFTAAMVNQRAAILARPERQRQALVPFNPWNADVLI